MIPIVALAAVSVLVAAGPAAAQVFRFVTTSDAHIALDKGPASSTAFGYVVSHIDALNPRPDFWIFGGDGYDEATDSANAVALWQEWKDIADPISDVPIYVAIGNHDVNNYGHFYGSGWSGDGTGPFKASWPDLPQNGPAGYQGVVYSFRYSNSIFCVVQTNTYDGASYSATYKVDAAQRAWLSAVLDTTTAVHKFVIGHAEAWPPSNSSNSSLEWNPSDRDAFWQVMTAHGVAAYVCGHIHLWNRDYFVASGYGNAPAVTTTRQVVCGGAGGGLVSGYGGKFYHFVVWDIDGATVSARVIDSYGAQRDSFGWTAPAGLTGAPAAVAGRTPAVRIRYYGGRIRWQGGIDRGVLSVYDIAGRLAARLDAAGGSAAWDPGTGRSGVYLVRLAPVTGGAAATGRIVVVR
ncbi:MAG: metallophosphoesterase [Candidatus Edwardsbacteria bacterium]|jgi:3',5'-cyclic AMP phosphodiesterase CpdA|nr:metallophosphoesterase [Candidatus Edwardsbacteria bacterium]